VQRVAYANFEHGGKHKLGSTAQWANNSF